MNTTIEPEWLAPTWFIDSDSPEVAQFAEQAIGDADRPLAMAVALFYAVRDGFRYDPYVLAEDPGDYRASVVAGSTANWCTPKSVLLTAAARHCGIPSRLGFADVRNHLTSEKLTERMGTDLFVWHGYSEFLIDGQWRKASSAFNIELCDRFGVKALEFDGTADSLMHPFDIDGNRHMEYVNERGSFDDLPLDEMHADFQRIYPSMYGEDAGAADSPDDTFAASDVSTATS